MQTWPVQDAKARFSEFLEACMANGPQMVTKRGTEAAVLVPVADWRRLQAAARPSLKQLLLAEEARTDLLIPCARYRPQAKGQRGGLSACTFSTPTSSPSSAGHARMAA